MTVLNIYVGTCTFLYYYLPDTPTVSNGFIQLRKVEESTGLHWVEQHAVYVL